jgi:hypothetical protein
MNPKLARLLTLLYPRAWRERYGAEFETLLLDEESGFGTAFNVIRSALQERIFPTQGGTMNPTSLGSVIKHPSAFLPLAMSLTALAMVLGYVALYGVVHQADEGAVAHLWQLLMAGQVPVVAFFAIKWLPRAPRPTLYVLGLQAGAVLASMAPVFFLGL